MHWRRTLAVNVAVQSLGAAASFGVVAMLARVAGPETQGEFAVFRSLIDFLVVLDIEALDLHSYRFFFR